MTVYRVACYERVSTDEQAMRGFSIEAQIDNLSDYCSTNKMKIVDHYTDEGVSGGKPAFKRPSMSRLLEDVQAGKIDMILFTKLDRWFRNVKEYFKVQEILDKHKVEWRAIHEDYDTTTANGRMAITIFLAIAQNEREKGSERVRAVLEHKRRNGEACFGGPIKPMGYKKVLDENGVCRLVKDPAEEQMVNEFWAILVKYNSINKAMRHMHDVYNVTRTQKTWYRMVNSPFYCGAWGDNLEFCEPYVSREDWLMIQDSERARPRKNAAGRVYVFSGMMRCSGCGHMLCGDATPKVYKGVRKEYHNYRCRFRSTTCDRSSMISEIKVEKYLKKHLRSLLEQEIAAAEMEKKKPKPKPKYNIPALKERLRRIEVVYMAGNKTDAEYLAETNEVKALIAKAEQEAPPPERDIQPLRDFLAQDFENVYDDLEPEEKQRFWRSIIKEIVLDGNQVKGVIFF